MVQHVDDPNLRLEAASEYYEDSESFDNADHKPIVLSNGQVVPHSPGNDGDAGFFPADDGSTEFARFHHWHSDCNFVSMHTQTCACVMYTRSEATLNCSCPVLHFGNDGSSPCAVLSQEICMANGILLLPQHSPRAVSVSIFNALHNDIHD